MSRELKQKKNEVDLNSELQTAPKIISYISFISQNCVITWGDSEQNKNANKPAAKLRHLTRV